MTASRISKADTPRTPPPILQASALCVQSWSGNGLSLKDIGLPKERMFNFLDIAPADEANSTKRRTQSSNR